MAVRVTQSGVEVLYVAPYTDPPVRVTMAGVEVLHDVTYTPPPPTGTPRVIQPVWIGIGL